METSLGLKSFLFLIHKGNLGNRFPFLFASFVKAPVGRAIEEVPNRGPQKFLQFLGHIIL